MLKRKLAVLNVAYPFAAVGPDAVGGAEQVVYALDRALVRAGHQSFVLGHASSLLTGELLPVNVPSSTLTRELRERIREEYRARLAAFTARVDVVHFHGVDCADYLPEDALTKSIVTLHLASDAYPGRLLDWGGTSQSGAGGPTFTCVSKAQQRTLENRLKDALLIENGVDLQRFRPTARPEASYVLCLGRVCPEKGFEVALRAANRAGVRLCLAGQVFPYPEHERYFTKQIAPLLGETCTFLGPVSGETKQRLLQNALCLMVPSRVEETSSLVTMEALASGTPVLVSRCGALPSLIEHGVTGFVAADEEELAAHLREVGHLDRNACRASAEARFDLEQSTASYLALYARLAG